MTLRKINVYITPSADYKYIRIENESYFGNFVIMEH